MSEYERGFMVINQTVYPVPPNYPVPAIRQWFEFGKQLGCYRVGTDLFDEYVVLFHCKQERFDADRQTT